MPPPGRYTVRAHAPFCCFQHQNCKHFNRVFMTHNAYSKDCNYYYYYVVYLMLHAGQILLTTVGGIQIYRVLTVYVLYFVLHSWSINNILWYVFQFFSTHIIIPCIFLSFKDTFKAINSLLVIYFYTLNIFMRCVLLFIIGYFIAFYTLWMLSFWH